MKIFRLRFQGVWLGGIIILSASTKTKAIEKIKEITKDESDFTISDSEIRENIEEVPKVLTKSTILYYDNGDY
jgi:predicted transcriptional regulator